MPGYRRKSIPDWYRSSIVTFRILELLDNKNGQES